MVRCIHLVIRNTTTNNFQFEDHLEARTRLDNLKRSSFQLHGFLHLRCICTSSIRYFWKTEIDLIIYFLFQNCNRPDFKFYLGKLNKRTFPTWCNLNLESISIAINSTKKKKANKTDGIQATLFLFFSSLHPL